MVEERLKQLPKALVEHRWNMYQALRSLGYSHHYASNPIQIRNTKTYKKVMEPVLTRLEKQRDRILASLESRENFDGEDFKELVKALATINKDVQLLGGKATDITKFVITEGDDRDNEDKSVDAPQESKDTS